MAAVSAMPISFLDTAGNNKALPKGVVWLIKDSDVVLVIPAPFTL